MTTSASSLFLSLARRQGERLHSAFRRFAPGDLLAMTRHFAKARWELRACDEVGPGTRVEGRLYVRNEGETRIGEWCLFESTVTPTALLVHPGARLTIGARSYLNFGVCIEARGEICIGSRCHLGQYVHLMDNDQHEVENHGERPASRPVILEDDVWLGAHAVVLRGVTIGQGTTVGAGSVVTRSLPPRCVAAGAPARVIRYLDEAHQSGTTGNGIAHDEPRSRPA